MSFTDAAQVPPQPSLGTTSSQPLDADAIDFVLHWGNADFLTGQRKKPILRHKGYGLLLNIVLALAFCAVALWFVSDFYDTYRQYTNLRDNGVTVQGQIVSGYIMTRTDQNGEINVYTVTFTYVYDGNSYRREDTVPYSALEAVGNDQLVRVIVNPDNPEEAKIEGSNKPKYVSLWIGLAIGVLSAGLGVWTFLSYRRAKPVGVMVQGSVVSATANYKKGRKPYKAISVAFNSPQSQPMTGTILSGYPRLAKRLPAKDDKVAIYYVDDKHWWLL